MISRFYILGSKKPRLESRRTIFVDGVHDSTFRQHCDLELSHWRPNITPLRYKADSSTEICMRFIESDPTDDWDLVINNHLDVDGVLSVFTLVESTLAMKHRGMIVQAAEMGDFNAWGNSEAQVLFQALAVKITELRKTRTDPQEEYERCFEVIREVLENKVKQGKQPEILKGIRALENSVTLIESGRIERHLINERLSLYVVPKQLIGAEVEQWLKVLAFNSSLTPGTPFLPHSRNKYDQERIQLLAIQAERGWCYDLWYPGYLWADTATLWRPPGIHFLERTNSYRFDMPSLSEVIRELQSLEKNNGTWRIAQSLEPFESHSKEQRPFPIVLSYLDSKGKSEQSILEPVQVAALISPCFTQGC